MNATITMGNDEFILFIRKQNTSNEMSNDLLGRKIWDKIQELDNTAVIADRSVPCLWENNIDSKNVAPEILPKSATQFTFNREILPKLYSFLETV